jgi:hypothetical protein
VVLIHAVIRHFNGENSGALKTFVRAVGPDVILDGPTPRARAAGDGGPGQFPMRWNHFTVEADSTLIGRKLLYLKDAEHLYPRRTARGSGSAG